MAQREETASLKPQTHKIQYIRSRETGGGAERLGHEQMGEPEGMTRAGTNECNPKPSLYCCLHSSGFVVDAPPLPFPLFFGGGTEPSESESCSGVRRGVQEIHGYVLTLSKSSSSSSSISS